MATTEYRFHSIEADGPWTSPPFPPAERRHIVQGVIGGFIMGRPRWAEDLSGNFIYGLDAKGKETTIAPAHVSKPTPRRRGKNKPKTAALGKPSLMTKRGGESGRPKASGYGAVEGTIGSSSRPKASGYGAVEGTIGSYSHKSTKRMTPRENQKSPAQLDAEIAAVIGPCDSFEPCHGNYACCIHAASTPGTMEYKKAQRVAKKIDAIYAKKKGGS